MRCRTTTLLIAGDAGSRWPARPLGDVPAIVASGAVGRASVGGVWTCEFCGRQEGGVVALLTWTTSVENGRRRTYCDQCSRTHLRAIESKLDSEWW